MERLVLAHPHKLVRYGLKMLLEQQPNIIIEAEVASLAELKKVPTLKEAKLLIGDYILFEKEAETLKEIKAMHEELKYLWLATPAALKEQKNQKKKRGETFLSKDIKPLVLYRQVKNILKLNQRRKADLDSKQPKKLSKRESEVLRLLCVGLNNRAIAEEIDLNEKTVSTYKQRILSKIGGSSMVDIYQYAQKKKLVVKA